MNEKSVEKSLKTFNKHGLSKSTQILVDKISTLSIKDMSLLDIGGGIGGIQFNLLNKGVNNAVSVEGSDAYAKVAKKVITKRGLQGKINVITGDFVEQAKNIYPADIVTLDKVICCYSNMPNLVQLSSDKANKIYGVIYPRDSIWVKIISHVLNFFSKLFSKNILFYIHNSKAVDNILISKGFKKIFLKHQGIWQIIVYFRT